jgi:acyl carrier protein
MEDTITQAVFKHLLKELEDSIGPDEITLESHLRDDLDINSLQAVGLVVDMEEEFDISVSDDEVATLQTVGDVVKAVKEKLKEKEER